MQHYAKDSFEFKSVRKKGATETLKKKKNKEKGGTEEHKGLDRCFYSSLSARDTPPGNSEDIKQTHWGKAEDIAICWIRAFSLELSLASSWTCRQRGGWRPQGWSTTTACPCRRTLAPRSTRRRTTRPPTTPRHFTSPRSTRRRTPRRPSTRQRSTARRTTPRRSTPPRPRPHTRPRPRTRLRPRTGPRPRMSPRTANPHATPTRRGERRRRKLRLPWYRWRPRGGPCTSPTTSSSRTSCGGGTWSRSAASWGPGRCAWIRSFTQVSGASCDLLWWFDTPVSQRESLTRWPEVQSIVPAPQHDRVLSVAGMAALHEAVLTGNLEVVKLLVKYGADVHQRDEDGWTPLHMACSDGYPEIAK